MKSLSLRHRLLAVLTEPLTVKAAAARLGVPVGRLYHHLDRLIAEGAIRLVAERRVRGVVERTFQTAEAAQVTSIRLRLTPERLGLLKRKLGDLLGVLETPDGVETEIALVASQPGDFPPLHGEGGERSETGGEMR